MSKNNHSVLAILILLLLVQSCILAIADDHVYKEGKVWLIIYVKTKPGMFDNYMENLN